MPERPLLIVGASARAAAASARRAGFSPIALDRFADRDLFQVARVLEIPRDRDVLGVVAELPSCDWMYTGGLENEPDLVDAISRFHNLLGNPGSVLRRVRDPLAWTSALREAGIPCLEVATPGMPFDRHKSWISKPLRSVGGLCVSPHDGGPIAEGRYLQERVEGRLIGAQFRVLAERTQFLGACHQWAGGPGAPGPFAYRASLGPLTLDDDLQSQLDRIATLLAKSFGLNGLFGVDIIQSPDGIAWPLEINPRYTAAIEVLEIARGCDSVLSRQIERDSDNLGARTTVGKCVLYAERPFTWLDLEIPEDVADIPRDGTAFHPGDPILTILTEAPDLCEVAESLRRKVETWRCHLGFLT